MIGIIWAEINTPTGRIGPLSAAYARAMGGVGHAVLGAALCAHLGTWGIGAAVVLRWCCAGAALVLRWCCNIKNILLPHGTFSRYK